MGALPEKSNGSAHLVIRPMQCGLSGRVRPPGDKSISHRAVLLGALAEGQSRIRGFLPGADCLATLGAMKTLGANVESRSPSELWIRGAGLHGLSPPSGDVDCGNAGTAMRLLAGLCAGQPFATRLVGSVQLQGRPMGRICEPLRAMGANIRDHDGKAPLEFAGEHALQGVVHTLRVASAQVKSGILLAGLYAHGTTRVAEPGPSRDHTERMLRAMGVHIKETAPGRIELSPPTAPLRALDLQIPADPSSAAFLMAAATLVPNSDVLLEGICINPTRDGFRQALLRMGANIVEENARAEGGESVADLRVRSAKLHGASFGGPDIVTLIDELPLLAAVATQAGGETCIEDAAELRVKETDRIHTTARMLQDAGMSVEERPSGFRVQGSRPWRGGLGHSMGDHRLALLFAIMGLIGCEDSTLQAAEVIDDSFPGFESCMQLLGAVMTRECANESQQMHQSSISS